MFLYCVTSNQDRYGNLDMVQNYNWAVQNSISFNVLTVVDYALADSVNYRWQPLSRLITEFDDPLCKEDALMVCRQIEHDFGNFHCLMMLKKRKDFLPHDCECQT